MPSIRKIYPEVKEIPRRADGRPVIKDGAVHVFDHEANVIYVYGGTPWDGNPDTESPTRETSNSFWSYDIRKKRWMDHSTTLFHYSTPVRKPFSFTEKRFEEEDPGLSYEPGLPYLYGASGQLVVNEVTRHRYIVIVGEDRKEVHGTGKKKIRHGGQIAISGLRKGDVVRLHVFGGISADGRTYCDDYMVADINVGKWASEDQPIPMEIMPLGCSPSALLIPEKNERGGEAGDKIILLKGHEEKLGVTFTNAYVMDVNSSIISVIVPEGSKTAPMNTYYMHSLPDSITPTSRKWLLIGWTESEEKDNSEYQSEAYDFDVRYKNTLDLVIYKLTMKFVKTMKAVETGPVPLRLSQEVIPETEDEDGSESEDCSTSEEILPERQTAKRSRPFNHPPAVRGDEGHEGTAGQLPPSECGRPIPEETTRKEVSQETSYELTWEKVSVGPVAKAIKNLEESFCVEYAVPLNEDVMKQLGKDMPVTPSILLLGYSPKFTGEVKAHCYNAYAVIPLERDDIESCNESDSASTMSGESYSPPPERPASLDRSAVQHGSTTVDVQKNNTGASTLDGDTFVHDLHQSAQNTEQESMYAMDIDNLVQEQMEDDYEGFDSTSGPDLDSDCPSEGSG